MVLRIQQRRLLQVQICYLIINLKKNKMEVISIKRALVLFNVQSGLEHKVLQKIKNVDGVEEAYISFGVYDIAAKIRTDYLAELENIIQKRFKPINEVRSISSMLLIER